MKPESLKHTINLKHDISLKNCTADHPSNVEGQSRPSNDANIQLSPTNNSQQNGVLANCSTEDKENPSENAQNQLVIFNSSANGAVENDIVLSPVGNRPLSSTREHPKVYPSVCAFTIQCANCFKWRIVPTKQKYEELREHILEVPFVCKMGQEWRPNISCDDPPDITQDGSRRWAIDKPNISLPPPGWQRLLRFRCEGSSKFADVYYVTPSSEKRLRSMVEVASFLDEHPEYVKQGVELSQFSFKTPKPLQGNSKLKRPAVAAPTGDVSDHGIPSEVQPLSGTSLDVNTDLQFSSLGSPGSSLGTPLLKKKKHRVNGCAARGLSLETHVPKKKRYRLNEGVALGSSSKTQLLKKRTPSTWGAVPM